jgi:hypothetical protein
MSMNDSLNDAAGRNPERHLRTLGICWLIYGILRLLAAAWLVSFASTATLMFGALLNRVPDPFSLMYDFHLVYFLIEVLAVICGVLGILAGLALLSGRRAARILALFAAFLSLSNLPVGITLGTYTLVVLL